MNFKCSVENFVKLNLIRSLDVLLHEYKDFIESLASNFSSDAVYIDRWIGQWNFSYESVECACVESASWTRLETFWYITF